MSMILDALSRAEQERRSENGVVLDPSRYVGSSSIKEERLKKWILIALVVNIVLAAIILLSYLWNQYASDSVPQPAVTEAPAEEPVVKQTVVSEQVSNKVSTPPIKSLVVASSAEEPVLSLQEQTVVNKNAAAPLVKKKQEPNNIAKKNPPVRYASKPLPTPNNNATLPQGLPSPVQNNASGYKAFSDLTAAERSALSQYEINVHVYDNNVQNRFVLINMTKYKEGDRLPGGGPVIAAITPEGVVLDTSSGKTLLERN